jgi:hypothetical protein
VWSRRVFLTGEVVFEKALVFEIGVPDHQYEEFSTYKRAMIFADDVRLLFEQNSVYVVHPNGTGFNHAG